MSATCACWPPESLPTLLLEREAEPLDALARRRASSQLGFSSRPSRERLADREAAVSGWSCATKPMRGSTAAARRAASARARATLPALGCEQPDGELQQRRLAGAVGADERGHRAARGSRACSRAAPRSSRSACRAPRSSAAVAHATLETVGGPHDVGEQRAMFSSSSPAARARSIHRCSDDRSAFTSSGGSGAARRSRRTCRRRAALRRALRDRARGRPAARCSG